MAAAFWPEFDWTFAGDFRHQLGEMAGAGSLAASLSAELYRKAFAAVSEGADAARHAPASERLQGRRLVSAEKGVLRFDRTCFRQSLVCEATQPLQISIRKDAKWHAQ